jgi:hypothetical protein
MENVLGVSKVWRRGELGREGEDGGLPVVGILGDNEVGASLERGDWRPQRDVTVLREIHRWSGGNLKVKLCVTRI